MWLKISVQVNHLADQDPLFSSAFVSRLQMVSQDPVFSRLSHYMKEDRVAWVPD